jgi:hypothetical protein
MKRKTNTVFGLVLAAAICLVVWSGRGDPRLLPHWAWLPGTLLGVVGGTFGGLAGNLAAKGRSRKAVLAFGATMLGTCAGMLAGGLVLLVMGRPWQFWYPWVLPGLIGSAVFAALIPSLRRRYDEAEMRRLSAKDISSQ